MAFAVYLFFTMLRNIDFSGMSFGDTKLVLSVVAGVAVGFVRARKGAAMISAAMTGFVCSAVLLALLTVVVQNIG